MSNILELDPRLYDLIRQKSIRTVQEALVELITNAYDAYKVVESDPTGSEVSGLPIEIECHDDINVLSVRDHARGLTSQEMTDRILKVGSLTAEVTSRGLMGRGAKDITAIGTARFLSIRNNNISEVVLNQDMTYDWIKKDEPVNAELREIYKIGGNGLIVYLTVDAFVKFIGSEELPTRISKNIYLRNIIKEQQHPIFINGHLIKYSHPPNGKKILDIEFEVDGYPGAFATLVIYNVDKAISKPAHADELEYGILVSTSKSVYECGGLYAEDELYSRDYRWNPNLKYIYGELRCDHIDILARQVSEGRTTSNPFLVIDPSRRQGLSKKHPLTIALYEIPYRWLEVTLNRIQDIHEDFMLPDEDIGSFLQDVSNYMQQNLQIESTLYTWRSKSDQDNLNSMVGRLNKIDIDKTVLNLENQTVQDILNGNSLTPIPLEGLTNEKPEIQIKISDDPDMIQPYDVIYFSNRIIIKINANDQSLRPFVTIETTPPVSPGGSGSTVEKSNIHVEGEGAMVSISDTLRDAVVHMVTRQSIISSTVESNISTDSYNEIRQLQDNIRDRISTHTAKFYDKVFLKYNA